MIGLWSIMIFVAGGVSFLCLRSLWIEVRRFRLPPADRRSIDRAARRNRADLRSVMRPLPSLYERHTWDREDTHGG